VIVGVYAGVTEGSVYPALRERFWPGWIYLEFKRFLS
jgi:hypothetical protein